ncbi:MAG: GrpB family protein [Bacillota bacterium]
MSNELKDMSNEKLWKLFPIILKPHNSNYKIWYKKEKKDLIKFIGFKRIKRISHIGSTYITDLVAKPTIDILLEVDKEIDLKELKQTLTNRKYICLEQTDAFSNSSLMCMKGYTNKGFSEKVFHLHIRLYNNHRELYFRDYLQDHPNIAKEYEKIKIKLAKKYRNHRDNYTSAKTDFINKYTDLAMVIYKDRYKPITE